MQKNIFEQFPVCFKLNWEGSADDFLIEKNSDHKFRLSERADLRVEFFYRFCVFRYTFDSPYIGIFL